MERLVTLAALFSMGAIADASASTSPGPTPINLSLCTLPGLDTRARCGDLLVPENPEQPNGRRLSFAVVVIPASGKALRDPIVPLMGGPGEAAIVTAADFSQRFAALMTDRDLVLVDQRGTGESNALRCDLYSETNPAAELREFFPLDAVRRCGQELEKTADLTQYTYGHFADDLENVRRALGYAQLNLQAGSYGTRAAQVFFNKYPQSVRTVYMGSVVPIRVPVPVAFAGAAEAMLNKTFDACAADAACRMAFPNLRKEFSEVLARLDTGEVRVTLPGHAESLQLNRGRVAEWFRARLYRPSTAAELPWLIHEAFGGTWRPIAEGILAQARMRDQELSVGLLFSITCAEDIPFLDEGDISRKSEGTALGDYRLRQQQKACELWPKASLPKDYRQAVRTDLPALFVSGDSDGGSPLWFTAHVASGFSNRAVVTMQNRGHTEWSDCIGRLYEQFVRAGNAKDLDGKACEPASRPAFKMRTTGSPTPSRAQQATAKPNQQATANPSDAALETVTVEALRQRQLLKRRVGDFVSSITMPSRSESLARWQVPICPLVAGLSPDKGEFILARLSQIARDADIPLLAEGCDANLLVVMTHEPEALLKMWWSKEHRLFNKDRGVGGIKRTIRSGAPVRVFYNACSVAPGTAKTFSLKGGPICGTGVPGSRLTWDAVRVIYSVIVVVDLEQARTLTFGPLTDYIAMTSLAQLRTDPELGAAPTILRLFDETDETPSQGLSAWDRAFLKSLYATDPDNVLQLSQIKVRMLDDVAPLARTDN